MTSPDISNTFVVAPLMDQQKKEAQIFEKGTKYKTKKHNTTYLT